LTRYETLPSGLKLEVARLTQGYEDKTGFFVAKLAQWIGTLAAAFWPKSSSIVRYAHSPVLVVRREERY
jgi:hypothetical protein